MLFQTSAMFWNKHTSIAQKLQAVNFKTINPQLSIQGWNFEQDNNEYAKKEQLKEDKSVSCKPWQEESEDRSLSTLSQLLRIQGQVFYSVHTLEINTQVNINKLRSSRQLWTTE